MSMTIYIYIYIHTYIYMYTYMYIHVYIYNGHLAVEDGVCDLHNVPYYTMRLE